MRHECAYEYKESCRFCNPKNPYVDELEALNAELVEALECYATHAEWTAEVFLQGENADGSEWEFTHDLDSEKVWNRAEHGWLLAQTTLAKARGDAQGNGG